MVPKVTIRGGNMGTSRFKIQYLPTIVLIVVGALVWMLACGNVASAFDFHTDSAHGHDTDGVNRRDVVPDPDHKRLSQSKR